MDEQKNEVVEIQERPPVDYITHEGMVARMERAQKRMFVLCIILIALLLGSWIGVFVYESQFEDVSVSQDIDTGEGDAVIAGVGDVYYGEDQTNGQEARP